MRKKPQPKRLFKSRPSPRSDPRGPDPKRLINALTAGRPTLRHAMQEALEALEAPDLQEILATVGETHKAGLILSWRDAAFHIANQKPCDCCDKVSHRIRAVVVNAGDDFRGVVCPDRRHSLTGFMVLCRRCSRTMTPAELKSELLDKYSALQVERGGPLPHRRAAVLGQAVGEVEQLAPGRAALMSCEECGRDIWMQAAELEHEDGPVGLCPQCTTQAVAAGRLELVPIALL